MLAKHSCAKLSALAIALALTLSCTDHLSSGSWGTFRYIGRVVGQPPLQLLPPISDRNGNVYTLYGGIGLPKVAAFVSVTAGGSFQSCTLTKGDTFGAHGWAGFTFDRAWYWSGDALVLVPSTGACAPVLDVDPSTNVDLLFRAVVPWVRDAPSRTTLVALIQSPLDPVPFSTLVDLGSGIATNVTQFQPSDATGVAVLGVGADPANGVGFVLLSFTENGVAQMEGLFFDEAANLVATAPVTGAAPPEYGILGYLEPTAHGNVVGLTSTGSLVTFSRSGGSVSGIDPSITPVGVHTFESQPWLVGTANGKPVVAPIDDNGQVGPAVEWTSSEQAASALAGPLVLNDDRSLPVRTTTWSTVTTAIGSSPFLAPESPWPEAPGTTLWAVAGPEFSMGVQTITSIAIAPVGISYP
jgi:hypothetical protein